MKFKILNILTLTSVLIILLLIIWKDLSWIFILIPFITWIVIVAFGSFHLQWNFFLKSINHGNASGNKIALTFDDGPHPVFTTEVLRLLEIYNAKASFFCIGKNVKAHPEILQKIHSQNHITGNHSFTHSQKIDFNDKNGWLREINAADEEIEKVIGKKPSFFRPPFGVTTPHLAKALLKTNHRVIGWDVRSLDTVGGQKPEKIVKRILEKAKPGSIVLLHDHLPGVVPILEQLLPELQKRNFTFVTIDELISSKHYEHTQA